MHDQHRQIQNFQAANKKKRTCCMVVAVCVSMILAGGGVAGYYLITKGVNTNAGKECEGVDCGPNGACNGGQCTCSDAYTGDNCEIPPGKPNESKFVDQVVPTTMKSSSKHTITIRFKNMGSDTWTKAAGFRIGSMNPRDNTIWRDGRVLLKDSDEVLPGQTYGFAFEITAPSTSGVYNIQWRMLDETEPNKGWFGPSSANQQVMVGNGGTNYCNPNPCLHGGACTSGSSSFSCDCTGTGYIGTRCETSDDGSPNICPYDPDKKNPGLCGCNVPENACGGVTIDRVRSSDLRIGVYNVMRSSNFPKDDGSCANTWRARVEGFKRIARAVKVDIWAMQELMYDGADQPGRTPAGLKRNLEQITGGTWHMAHHTSYQEFIFSRFPVIAHGSPGRRVLWALLDVDDDGDSSNDILAISVHFMTDSHAQDLANFFGDVFDRKINKVSPDVTIMVLGDFNSNPKGPRPATVQNALNGVRDLRPIWLGTPNTRYTHGSIKYTNGQFNIAQNGEPIDYIFPRIGKNAPYCIAKNFILSTLILDQSVLNAHNLQPMDVALKPDQAVNEGSSVACDHFPLFLDLKRC